MKHLRPHSVQCLLLCRGVPKVPWLDKKLSSWLLISMVDFNVLFHQMKLWCEIMMFTTISFKLFSCKMFHLYVIFLFTFFFSESRLCPPGTSCYTNFTCKGETLSWSGLAGISYNLLLLTITISSSDMPMSFCSNGTSSSHKSGSWVRL